MAALVGCDNCGGVADPIVAENEWLVVMWKEIGPSSPMQNLMGQTQQQTMEQRHFCSLDCLGCWASSNEAIKGVGGR